MHRSDLSDRIVLAGIAAIATAAAIVMLRDYHAAPDLLWRDIYHDRNGHYDFGLTLALALRDFNLVDFLGQVERSRVWGPFHGLVLSTELLIGGIDVRLAIVPSLIGWTITVIFAALIARRFFADPAQRACAAVCAAALVMASPAFRLLGSDVMLEGLGAGLTAVALWAWIMAREDLRSAGRWRFLAIVLTLLFFHKGNYWGLLTAALAVAWLTEDARKLMPPVRDLLARAPVRQLGAAVVRDPLLIAALLVAFAVGAILLRGPTAIELFGNRVSLYPPANLTTVAYVLVFVRLAILWRRHRTAIEPMLGVSGRQIFLWHVVPVAISFLLPKRLSTFLWFISPSNNPSKASYALTGGLDLYWDSFSTGFSAAPWIAALAIALFAVALLRIRALPRGAWVVFIFAAISLAAVLVHPQRQGRFLGSWIFAVWIGSGIGAAVLLGLLPERARTVRMTVAGAAMALLTIGLVWQPPSPRAFVHAIRTTSGPINLELFRPVLADIRQAKTIGMAATFGNSQLLHWMAQEDCKCRKQFAPFNPGAVGARDDVRVAALDYFARSRAERIVVVDAPDDRLALGIIGWQYDKLAGIVDAAERQQRYVKAAEYAVPSYGARVSVWALKP